jgi:N-acetylneuraminic acid mutarotase
MKLKSTLLLIVFMTIVTLSSIGQIICSDDTLLSISQSPTSGGFRTIANASDIFVFGNQVNTQCNKYSTILDNWSSIAPMPTPRGDFGVAEVNGKVYCIGGYTGSWSNKNESYDIATNTWSIKNSLPVAISGCFATVLNGNIYIIGGTAGNTTTFFYKYDPINDTYTLLTPPPQSRMHTNLVAFNNKIYFIGGYYFNGTYNTTDMFDEYNPLSNTWSVKPALPAPIFNCGTSFYNNKLYLFGGSTGFPWTASNSVYEFDFNLNNWTVLQNLSFSKAGISAETINDEIFLLGGVNSQIVQTNTCYKIACIPCALNTQINPTNNILTIGSTATFSVATSDPNPSYVWQSDFGQGFQTLNEYGNYSGVNTATLNIANIQLSEHNQPIRVISTSGNCIDTSNVSVINILDTCITNVTVYDTLLTTVTDTLVINALITGINPPNNLNTVKVFPNPANTHITIDYGNFNSMSGYTLKIVNSFGQTIFTTPINQQTSYIDLSTWTGNGIYFVQLIDPQNNTIENRKILIQ